MMNWLKKLMLFRLRIHTTVLVKKIDHNTKINEIERKFIYYDHVNISLLNDLSS